MTRLVDDVRLRGAGLSRDLIAACTKADLNGSLSEVTQLSLTFTDPRWTLLDSGIFTLGAMVDVEDIAMEIASISTGADADAIETTMLKCRPRIIRKLRDRRGARVMRNASPSDFVVSECKAVGAKYKVQASSKRKQVARDVAKKGTQEVDTPPSSWTTFQRLARECGFILFEAAGVVYFGRPSWLISEGGTPFVSLRYRTGADDDYRLYSIPQASRSLDSPGQQVDSTVRVPNLSRLRSGTRIALSGVPTFNGNYLTTQFDVDLLDARQLMNITMGQAENPAPQTTGDSKPRVGTRLASDFVYWVRKQVGNRYLAGTQVSLGSYDPNQFDGAELAQWAASQIGVYLPEGANAIFDYCIENGGVSTSLSLATRTAGQLVWRPNYMGITLGNNQVVEQVGGKVGIRKGGITTRYQRSVRIPSVLY